MSKSPRAIDKARIRMTNTISDNIRKRLANTPIENWPPVFEVKHQSVEYAQALERVKRDLYAALNR